MRSSAHSEPDAVRGIDLDAQTRCAHYHLPVDIVAIRMRCCDTYYACKDCHDALAGHPLEPWPRSEWSRHAILCGACRTEMSVADYLGCGDACPHCGSAFNPGCRLHHHYYFEAAP
ncbi:MAG TPA: CHY zinc finger protein [Rhizomicrobium sp.]|jgi:uncharacterized CHY-type Zn-finger protein